MTGPTQSAPVDFDSKEVVGRRVVYDMSRGRFWAQNAKKVWAPFNETQLSRLLQLDGFNPKLGVENPKSIDRELLRLQMECPVDFAGSLAGYQMGEYEILGSQILVTSAPKLIRPQKGEWRVLGQLLENLFLENEAEKRVRVKEYGGEITEPPIDQRPYIFGWLRVGLQSLMANKRHPGQALIIAGERDCGKSLFQTILTELYGGRAAKPYRSLTDSTNFNGDMFGAEHLVIGDEACRTDMRSRKAFATQIKGVVAETVQRMEAKHKDALSLTPFWRLSISLNLEPENILVLPPVDEDIADKVTLTKAYKRPLPWNIRGPEDREPFWNALTSELPAFVHFLLHEFEIPERLHSRRFGVTHFHHPEILSVIDSLSAQDRLLELIDRDLFERPRDEWQGTALELESALKDKDSPVRDQAKELLGHSNSCGAYLGKLAKKYPNRVRQNRSKNCRGWIVFPPQDDAMTRAAA